MDLIVFVATAGGGLSIVDAITQTASNITADLGGVLPIALGIAGSILAAFIGWKLFKRFSKS